MKGSAPRAAAEETLPTVEQKSAEVSEAGAQAATAAEIDQEVTAAAIPSGETSAEAPPSQAQSRQQSSGAGMEAGQSPPALEIPAPPDLAPERQPTESQLAEKEAEQLGCGCEFGADARTQCN